MKALKTVIFNLIAHTLSLTIFKLALCPLAKQSTSINTISVLTKKGTKIY
jgi:hypothetical protein